MLMALIANATLFILIDRYGIPTAATGLGYSCALGYLGNRLMKVANSSVWLTKLAGMIALVVSFIFINVICYSILTTETVRASRVRAECFQVPNVKNVNVSCAHENKAGYRYSITATSRTKFDSEALKDRLGGYFSYSLAPDYYYDIDIYVESVKRTTSSSGHGSCVYHELCVEPIQLKADK